jgi:hypothetical protein
VAIGSYVDTLRQGELRARGMGRPRAVSISTREQRQAVEAGGAMFRACGLEELDCLRVLVCQGSSLLHYVGFFRDGVYSRAEVSSLQHLLPDLRRRAFLDKRLECVYRRSRSPVPVEADHRFRSMPIT